MALLALFWILHADPFQLRPAVALTSGATPIDLEYYAIPCVTDWNGDGRKDLLVGYRNADKIALFLNYGTDAAPVFSGYSNLQANGTDIVIPGSGCGAPAPWVCDFDGDGKRDLLVGSGMDGTVFFFPNVGTDAAPRFNAGVRLTLFSGDTLTVSSRATPYVHDWDADGLPDLLCGAGDGAVYFFRNVGSTTAPVFLSIGPLQAGGTTLNLGIRSVVRVYDWDGDGLKDLVGSSTSGVYWCRNTGNNPAPSLSAPVALRVPNTSGSLVPINTGPRMRLDLADWNNDGVMDIILGNADGTVVWYEGYPFAITRITARADRQVTLRWNSAPFLRYVVLTGAIADAIKDPEAANVVSEGKVTAWTNHFLTPQQFFRIQSVP